MALAHAVASLAVVVVEVLCLDDIETLQAHVAHHLADPEDGRGAR